MMDEKKKVAVVGVLFVLVLGIGAFQFTGGSEPPPVAKKVDDKKAELAKEEEAKKPKNPTLAFDLSSRDPFEAPEPPKIVPPAPPADPVKQKPIRNEGTTPFPPTDFQRIPPPLPGRLSTNPAPPATEEPKFGYTIAGVMLGSVPIVVFRDGSGAQRLVREGGALDGDTKVLSIQKGKVTVSFRGKPLELTNGGSASAK